MEKVCISRFPLIVHVIYIYINVLYYPVNLEAMGDINNDL